MNFYKRFIGDIQAKTGGLTLAEFGAYDRLLDHYYSTEKPITFDEIYRICRAMTGGEKAAVQRVLVKFFERTPEGWAQAKADEQIAKALPLIEAARENGKKGGRPPKPKTQKEPSGFQKQNPEGTQQEPSAKASQSQSQTHSPSLRSGEVGSDALPGVSATLFADYIEVRRAKKAGKFTATAASGLLREAERAGITVERAVQACCEYSWIGFRSDWFAERQATTARRPSGNAPEPGWRTEQRERTQQAAPGVASRESPAEFFDSQTIDAPMRRIA